jgi:hypothetical protein
MHHPGLKVNTFFTENLIFLGQAGRDKYYCLERRLAIRSPPYETLSYYDLRLPDERP